MAFDSLDYVLLLGATLLLFYRLGPHARLVLLVLTSLFFYAAWNLPLVSLIIISAIVDFTAARGIEQAGDRSGRRKAWLALSLVVNLGLLGYFKYANFFVENVRVLMGDSSTSHYLEVLLPPGISFYTFQTMSYTIDVYRGQTAATSSFTRFLLYVSFFPQLVAGPIERAGRLLHQFGEAAKARFEWSNLVMGLQMITWGMFKKAVIADHCGLIADRVYAAPGQFGGWSALIATYAFTLQIYCDFSAYSEIARGSARLFGVELSLNFDQPYLTTNIRTFWRRWHISLSNWFRDYVYRPLGGSRSGRSATLRNLTITMFLSGLWHGAAWSFVLWGIYHGLLLLMTTLIVAHPLFGRVTAPLGRPGVFVAWIVNFHLVVLGWVLFRVDRLTDVGIILGSIGEAVVNLTPPSFTQAGFIAGLSLFLLLSALKRRFGLFERIQGDPVLSPLFHGLLIISAVLFSLDGSPQFIYFQF